MVTKFEAANHVEESPSIRLLQLKTHEQRHNVLLQPLLAEVLGDASCAW